MDDTIHVQIEVVKLLKVGIGAGCVDGYGRAIKGFAFFNCIHDDGRVFARKPTEKCWDSHSRSKEVVITEEKIRPNRSTHEDHRKINKPRKNTPGTPKK